ncbi:MAG: FxsA family protein [Hyphomicrobium sp.]|nr:FxsA family protein [Hyphomicrobium sp.]
MAQPLRLAFLIALLAFPILEIGLLIRAGQYLGFWKLALIVLGTALLGTAAIRRTGLSVLAKARAQMEAGGQQGIDPLLDGLMQITAGMLLIFPGLICDVIGLLLLVPLFRQLLVTNVLPKLFTITTFGVGREGGPFRRPARPQDDGEGAQATSGPFDPMQDDGVTIEGEYERVSEETLDPQRGLKARAPRRTHT